MRLRSLVFFALTTIVAAACAGDDATSGGHGAYLLEGGEFGFHIETIPVNDCWPPSNPFDLVDVLPALVWSLDLAVDATNGNVSLVFVPAYGIQILPPIEAGRVGHALGGAGDVDPMLVVSTSCAYASSGIAVGELSDDNVFDLDLLVTLSASNEVTGLIPSCAGYEGTTVDIAGYPVPLPTLDEPANGACDLRFRGEIAAFD